MENPYHIAFKFLKLLYNFDFIACSSSAVALKTCKSFDELQLVRYSEMNEEEITNIFNLLVKQCYDLDIKIYEFKRSIRNFIFRTSNETDSMRVSIYYQDNKEKAILMKNPSVERLKQIQIDECEIRCFVSFF